MVVLRIFETERDLRPRLADIAVGVGVFLVGVLEVDAGMKRADPHYPVALFFLALLGTAVGCYRLRPGLGLALAWIAGMVQIRAGIGVMLTELSLTILAYGAARHGSLVTVWAAGLSIPAGCATAAWYYASDTYRSGVGFGWLLLRMSVSQLSITTIVLPLVLGLLILTLPWVVGLLLGVGDTARRNRVERERAEAEALRSKEIADMRAGQARLARDVHDVVGHSLTVILAQADSAQFMPDSDIESIRAALGNIAQSARRSLGDVRQVLSSTGDAVATSEHVGELDTLVAGVRAAGNEVVDRVSGVARPLPPELDVVAFRVLQEMLTNALKHGARGAMINVDRTWGPNDLRIEVRNVPVQTFAWQSADGLGVTGMRRRLESVGGQLDVRSENGVFIARAWVPLRPRLAR